MGDFPCSGPCWMGLDSSSFTMFVTWSRNCDCMRRGVFYFILSLNEQVLNASFSRDCVVGASVETMADNGLVDSFSGGSGGCCEDSWSVAVGHGL